MSTHANALPASAGADIDVGFASGGRASSFFTAIAGHLRRWLDLRRQLGEIQVLSDRELSDIGLGEGEIYRLRRGDVFNPVRWTKDDITRDQMPL